MSDFTERSAAEGRRGIVIGVTEFGLGAYLTTTGVLSFVEGAAPWEMVVVLVLGIVAVLTGLACFLEGLVHLRRRRKAPPTASVNIHVLSREAPEWRSADPPDDFEDLVELDRLPADLAAIVRPFFPADIRRVRPDLLEEAIAGATHLLAERERFARQEALTLDWQAERELSRSHAAYVAGLRDEERAALQMQIDAQAGLTAARADCARMTEEIASLKRQLREAHRAIEEALEDELGR
jgi:hypothetical protein